MTKLNNAVDPPYIFELEGEDPTIDGLREAIYGLEDDVAYWKSKADSASRVAYLVKKRNINLMTKLRRAEDAISWRDEELARARARSEELTRVQRKNAAQREEIRRLRNTRRQTTHESNGQA